MSQIEDEIRRRRIMEAMRGGLKPPLAWGDTPGFAGGTLEDQIRRSGRLFGAIPESTPTPNAVPGSTSPILPPSRTGINITMPPAPDAGPAPPDPVRIGYSTAGLSGVDRLMQRRRAMEEASPMSTVKTVGDFEEIQPPKIRAGLGGRFKGIGEGGLAGLAMGAEQYPNHPLRALGSGIGGLIAGATSREGGPILRRKFEMSQLDNDVARGLKLKQEEAQLASIEALQRQREIEPIIDAQKLELERQIQNEKLEIERQKAAGLITRQEADRRQKELDRQSRESIAAARITSQEKIAGMRGGNSAEVRQAKSAAAESEYNSLLIEEEVARKEKDRAYGVLDQMRKDSNLTKEDIKQAEDAAQNADKVYGSFAEKKRDAQRRMQENKITTAGTPQATRYAGRTMTRANLERYAKDKGITVEEAQRQLEAMQITIR